MKIYKSNHIILLIYYIIGCLLITITFGLGFKLFYEFFFEHVLFINKYRLYKYLRKRPKLLINKYTVINNSNGYLDIIIKSKLKLTVQTNSWGLWYEDKNNSIFSFGELIIQNNPLCYFSRILSNKINTEINTLIINYYDNIEDKGKFKYKCKFYSRQKGKIISIFCNNNTCIKISNTNKRLPKINFDDKSCYCILGNIYVDWIKNVCYYDTLKYLSKT